MIITPTRNHLISNLDKFDIRGVGIEIGVQKGDFSEIIIKNWKNCQKLYLMDAWKHQDENVYIDKANVENIEQEKLMNHVIEKFSKNKRIFVIQDFSPKGANRFPDNYFSFIYIDADHSYEAVKNDLEAWFPKLKKGGIFSGHDYNMDGMWNGEYGIFGDFGVTKAVNEFADKLNYKVNNTLEPVCQTWWFIKN